MDPRDFDGFDPDTVWNGHMNGNGSRHAFDAFNGASSASIRAKGGEPAKPANIEEIDAGIAAGKFGRFIDPTKWEGLPPQREWFWYSLGPKKHVLLFNADGGSGKSTIAAQLAVAANFGFSLFGLAVNDGEPCKSLVLAAEDDHDELWRRYNAITKAMGRTTSELANIRLVDLVGYDATLATADRGKLTPNDFYRSIKRYLETWAAKLLVVDSLADFFPGNEIVKSEVVQFMQLLKQLCREHDLTIIVLAHPSMSGMASGSGTSGNTAWNNSARSRLYMETDATDSDLRKLTTKKANYGPKGGEIVLRYQAGTFIVEPGTGTLSGLDRKARANKAECKFLELLAWHHARNMNVSAKPSRSYAPALFAEHAKADGLSKADFKDAMSRLLDTNAIENVTEGPPSKRIQALKLASAEPELAAFQRHLPTSSNDLPTPSNGVCSPTPNTPVALEHPPSGWNPQGCPDSRGRAERADATSFGDPSTPQEDDPSDLIRGSGF